MAHESATEWQGVSRAGRWASRALMVLGGVAAGTAAAWVISGASASADTTVPLGDVDTSASVTPVTPVTNATAADLHDAGRGAAAAVGDATGAASSLRDTACQHDATSWSIPSSESAWLWAAPSWCEQGARDEIGDPVREHGAHHGINQEMSDQVSGAVGTFADDSMVHPVQRTLGTVDHIVATPQDAGRVIKDSLTPSPQTQDIGTKFWNFLSSDGREGLLRLPGLPGQPGVGPVTPAPGAARPDASVVGALVADGVHSASRAGSGAGASMAKSRSHGGQGDVPSPFAPAGLPSAPIVPGAPSSAPGGHFDGPAFGVPAWSSALLDNAKAGSIRAGGQYMPLTPGSQPGVAPD